MTRTLSARAGLILGLLAMVAQLVLGASVPAVPAWQGLGDLPICHATSGPSETPQQPAHHNTDCLLCPFCFAVAAPSVLLPAGGVTLALPTVVLLGRFLLAPPATGPPARSAFTGQPRAPPLQA